MIDVSCPKCQQMCRFPDGSGGKRGTCSNCDATVQIPTVALPDKPTVPLSPSINDEQNEIIDLLKTQNELLESNNQRLVKISKSVLHADNYLAVICLIVVVCVILAVFGLCLPLIF